MRTSPLRADPPGATPGVAGDRAGRLVASAVSPRAEAISPWVWAVVGAWYLQISTFVLVGSAAGVLPSVRGLVGVEVVGSTVHRPWGVAFTVLALVSVLLSGFVLLGHGFATRGLAVAGTVGTVGLAVLGSWAALVVPAAMLLALLLTLLSPALDHLEPTAAEEADR